MIQLSLHFAFTHGSIERSNNDPQNWKNSKEIRCWLELGKWNDFSWNGQSTSKSEKLFSPRWHCIPGSNSKFIWPITLYRIFYKYVTLRGEKGYSAIVKTHSLIIILMFSLLKQHIFLNSHSIYCQNKLHTTITGWIQDTLHHRLRDVINKTRKRSSGMRTARLPTISHCKPCLGWGWALTHPPPGHTHSLAWTDWQTSVKTLPSRNFVDGKNKPVLHSERGGVHVEWGLSLNMCGGTGVTVPAKGARAGAP